MGMATTVFTSLTDVELLRAARTSPMMNAPLFAELVDRFETDTESASLRELRFQQRVHAPKPAQTLPITDVGQSCWLP